MQRADAETLEVRRTSQNPMQQLEGRLILCLGTGIIIKRREPRGITIWLQDQTTTNMSVTRASL